MAVGVRMPAKKQGADLSKLFALGGAAAGAATGSPHAAMMGMSAGSTLGGMAQPQQVMGPEPIMTGSSDAMQERLNKLNNSNIRQIAESINSLKAVEDDALREELAKPLLQADYLARRKGLG